MSQETPQRKHSWFPRLLVLAALSASVAIVVTPTFKPMKLEIGDNVVMAEAGFLTPAQGYYADRSGFTSTFWDGPTGEFSHGRIYGLKLGSWLYRVDIVNEPIAAARRRLPSNVPALIGALDSRNPWIRLTAAEELARRGASAREAIPVLVRKLTNDADGAIYGPLLELCKHVGHDSAIYLARGLDTSSPLGRERLLEILAELGADASAVEPSVEKYLNGDDAGECLRAALTLWKINRSASAILPAVMKLLTNGDPELRAGAAAVLGELGPEAEAAVPSLISALHDSDNKVRAMSARTLGLVGSSARPAIPTLVQRLRVAEGMEQQWVISALGQFGQDACEAVPTLSGLLKGEPHGTGRWSVEALASMGTEAVPALLEAFQDDRFPMRSCAARALCKIGPAATNAISAMIEELRSGKAGTIIQAVRVLGSVGPAARESLPALRSLLNDDVPAIRIAAAGAMWKIGETNDSYFQILIDGVKNERTRRAAVVALGDIGPTAKAAVPVLTEALSDRITSITRDASNALQRIEATK